MPTAPEPTTTQSASAPRAVRRLLARLARLGAWAPGDGRNPGRDAAAAASLVEGLRAAGYAAVVAATPPHPKAGKQLEPEYQVTFTAAGAAGPAGRGTGSRYERAVWRAARALAEGLSA